MHYKVYQEKFRLIGYQRHNLWAAMARASEIAATKAKLPKEALIDLIATDFLATNNFGLRGDPKAQQQYVAKMERLLGRRLVVVNMETKAVEYGYDALEAIAQDAPDE